MVKIGLKGKAVTQSMFKSQKRACSLNESEFNFLNNGIIYKALQGLNSKKLRSSADLKKRYFFPNFRGIFTNFLGIFEGWFRKRKWLKNQFYMEMVTVNFF